MGIFDIFNKKKITDTIFYKEFKEDANQLDELNRILSLVSDEKTKKKIEQEIYAIKKGNSGEEAVCYEIKNSFIPMLVLHNVRIVVDENVAQMDYVLITHKFVMVVETKKLNSDININQYGDFELVGRTYTGKFYKSGIYSPIVQNERHIRILSKLLEKNNLLKKTTLCSEIFLSNHKATINRKYAPENIKGKVHKLDKFTEIVTNKISSISSEMSESKMYEIADLLVKEHRPITYDYEKKFMVDMCSQNEVAATVEESNDILENIKYSNKIESEKIATSGNEEARVEKKVNNSDEDKIRNKLIEYRKIKAREEKIQAYCILKNETIENIINVKPNSPQELRKLKGMGDKTVDKYGIDILKIVHGME